MAKPRARSHDTGKLLSGIRRKSVSFCGIGRGHTRGSRIVQGRFWGQGVVSVVRFGAREGPREAEGDVPAARTTIVPEMEPIENTFVNQWLVMKVRSRLRVICATPLQKRSDSHG